MRTRPRLFALILVVSWAPSARAQDETSTVLGRVIDAETRQPLNGAFVTWEGARPGTWTAADGLFRLDGMLPGEMRHVHIELIGYGIATLPATALSDAVPLDVPLRSDPVVLEGFRIVSDRFKRRRSASTMSVRTFDARALQMATTMDMKQFIESRAFVRERPCGRVASFQGSCALVRGRVQPITVCIDETPMLGGLYMLGSLRPDDMSMLEIYSGGRVIRAYTKAFMEQASRRRLNPQPLEFAC